MPAARPPHPLRPSRLSCAEQDRLARHYLPLLEGRLRRRWGEDAVEIAGEVLAKALRHYDPARNDSFEAYLYQRLQWRALNDLAQRRRREVPLSFLSPATSDPDAEPVFEPIDPDPGPAVQAREREAFRLTLDHINQLDGTPRWAALGVLLGGFSHGDIALIIGRNKRHIDATLAALRGAGALS